MQFDPQPYDWLAGLRYWGAVVGVCLAFVLLLSVVISLLIAGISGPQRVGRQILEGLRDFRDLSLRRVWALAVLTLREALRRKALAVFVVFAVLFMFAGWFLSDANPRPDLQIGVYISFVLTSVPWLILPVLLLMSCWSIPEDTRTRSLHTVVTKPARRLEIVLGRMIGFGVLGTILIAVMGVVSYVWVVRNFPAPTVEVNLIAADGSTYPAEARLSHRVDAWITDPAGQTFEFSGPDDLHVVQEVRGAFPSAPEIADQLQAELAAVRKDRPVLLSRVPLYGELTYRDREGNPTSQGLNVGDEWKFRSYIEGATLSRAVWTFENVWPELLGDTLQFESTFEAFRTHKGEITKGLMAQFTFAKNLREQTAEALSTPGDRFASLRQPLRDGSFQRAGAELRTLADGIQKGQLPVTEQQFPLFRDGYRRFAAILQPFLTAPPAPTGAPAEGDSGANPSAGSASGKWERLPQLIEAARSVEAAAAAQKSAELGGALARVGELLESEDEWLSRGLVDLRVPFRAFEVHEYSRDLNLIPRKLPNILGSQTDRPIVDLYDDLTHGGELRVELACLDAGQYIGVARPDLFIRLPDRPFASGFTKAIVADWLKLLLVVIFGVTAGCFLKGPVAALLTLTLIVLGSFFHEFMRKIVTREMQGMGPIESAIKIVQHDGQTVPLEGWQKALSEAIDPILLKWMEGVLYIIPDLSRYAVAEYAVKGHDVPWSAGLLPALVTTLAYFFPFLLLGYYSLKLRELEAK